MGKHMDRAVRAQLVASILSLWPAKTSPEIARELGVKPSLTNTIIYQQQKAGRAVKLTRAENNRRIKVALRRRYGPPDVEAT